MVSGFWADTEILSEHGWREIPRIHAGLKVVTHLGRFRQVTECLKESIRLTSDGTLARLQPRGITFTRDRQFLTLRYLVGEPQVVTDPNFVEALKLRFEKPDSAPGDACHMFSTPKLNNTTLKSLHEDLTTAEWEANKPWWEMPTLVKQERIQWVSSRRGAVWDLRVEEDESFVTRVGAVRGRSAGVF